MIEEVAEHLYRLELTLPARRSAATNCYIIKGTERNLIIDPGHDHEECLTVMLSALQKLDIDLDRTDFFITHSHGDHYGLLRKLIRDGASVFASCPDADVIRGKRSIPMLEDLSQFLEASGFPERDAVKILPPFLLKEQTQTTLQSASPVFRLMADGEWIEAGDYRFQCVHTPGHSDGHMCLYEPDKKLFISGDHIIGTIGPSVSGRFNHQNPLEQYLESLGKIKSLEVEKVLPGHGKVFSQCQERIKELETKIAKRSQEILLILQKGGKNAYETASRVAWNIGGGTWEALPIFHRLLATQKTCAYLTYLENKRKITKEMREGAWVFEIAGTA
jgi:glyoxylase-like metal-dependent hydrolase (beta-lactamase superfamily II)